MGEGPVPDVHPGQYPTLPSAIVEGSAAAQEPVSVAEALRVVLAGLDYLRDRVRRHAFPEDNRHGMSFGRTLTRG
jgi:hypothetical protein